MPEAPRSIRILHLEDSPRDAELIHDRLATGNLVCDITAVNSRERFETALAGGGFDLILTDYNIPGYDGLSALKFARERQSDTPVIVVSGSLGEEEAVKCLHLGATDYLLKQRLERLAAAVERALEEARQQRQRRRAEEELRESEERFREQAELLDKARDAIWVEDLDGYITYWNKSAERLYGWSAAEALGRDAFQLLLAGRTPPEIEPRQAVFENGEWAGEFRHVSKTGETLDVEGHFTLILDSAGRPKCILSINTDITEKKHLATQVLRKQRLESIGTLAGGLAHDLNNALAPVLMSLDLLRQSYPDEAPMLDTLETSAMRGAEMVRHLLTFAKGSECEHTLLRPRHLLDEVKTIVNGTFPKNIQVRIGVARNLQMILGNATQLHQVLLNLCVNARDAMPEGGTLTLEAENVEIDATYASAFPDASPGRYVVYRVADTGTGIPAETLDRIFDPFFTTKGPSKGTGLGLSTVIGIVKSHCGFVHVDSTPGQGSTFSVYLPAEAESAASPHSPSDEEESLRGNGETVLVVDDDLAMRQTVHSVLTALDYEVVTVSDGTEALVAAAEIREKLRVVIADLHMPHMDGFVLLRAIKRMLPGVGVIVFSGGNLDGREANELKTLEIDTLLEKPFTQRKLAAALKAALER